MSCCTKEQRHREKLEDKRNSREGFDFVYGMSDSMACLCIDDELKEEKLMFEIAVFEMKRETGFKNTSGEVSLGQRD